MKIDYDINWGSHLPVLIKVMNISQGPVLEMGAGLYSTPFLYWLCKNRNRKFVSYENDLEWCKTMKIVKYVANWDDAYIEKNWAIVLIDHRPSQRRVVDIVRVANYADYVVVHDTQRNSKFCDYEKIYSFFKYRYDYKKAVPHTTVLSNFIDVSNLDV